jgi:hypothetical protein
LPILPENKDYRNKQGNAPLASVVELLGSKMIERAENEGVFFGGS